MIKLHSDRMEISFEILAGLDRIAAALLKKGKSIGHNEPIMSAKTVDLS